MTRTAIKLPIRGLVAKKGEYFVRYNTEDRETPFELWRGESWLASYATRARAVEEMEYRIDLGSPEGLWD